MCAALSSVDNCGSAGVSISSSQMFLGLENRISSTPLDAFTFSVLLAQLNVDRSCTFRNTKPSPLYLYIFL